jgi:hypothetical protein
LAAEKLAAENDVALLEAETKADEDRIKQEQEYQQELARYKKLYADKIITEEEYNRYKAAAKKQQDELDRQRELAQLNTTLGGLNTLAGALGEMFGQSKDLAIAQAGINGALAVTKILAETPKGDFGIMTGILIAAAIVTTISQISKIKKEKAPKSPKFFYGGFTGSTPYFGRDEFGPMTGIVHDQEYVIPKAMTQSPRYANTIAWLEAERTGKTPRKFADGGPTSSNMIPDQVIVENDTEMKDLLTAVLFRLNNPIAPNLVVGYEQAQAIQDLNDERAASDLNGTVNE